MANPRPPRTSTTAAPAVARRPAAARSARCGLRPDTPGHRRPELDLACRSAQSMVTWIFMTPVVPGGTDTDEIGRPAGGHPDVVDVRAGSVRSRACHPLDTRGVPRGGSRRRRLDRRLPVEDRGVPGPVAGAAGRHRRAAADRTAAGRRDPRRVPGRGRRRVARDHALAAPVVLRVLPGERVRPGDRRGPAGQRPRRAGHGLGDLARRHRGGDPRPRLVRRPARPATSVPQHLRRRRGDPGQRLQRDA